MLTDVRRGQSLGYQIGVKAGCGGVYGLDETAANDIISVMVAHIYILGTTQKASRKPTTLVYLKCSRKN